VRLIELCCGSYSRVATERRSAKAGARPRSGSPRWCRLPRCLRITTAARPRFEDALPVQRNSREWFSQPRSFCKRAARREMDVVPVRQTRPLDRMDFAVLQPGHAVVHCGRGFRRISGCSEPPKATFISCRAAADCRRSVRRGPMQASVSASATVVAVDIVGARASHAGSVLKRVGMNVWRERPLAPPPSTNIEKRAR